MNKKALSLAITLAMALPATVSNALSLGDIESNSSLNQPFRGKINLLSTNAAEAKNLRVRVASPEVFNRVGIDRPAFLNSIRFRTTVQNGRPVILVSSNQPINEPFLNFLLEVSWPNGQLLKEYTVLLDPPVLLRADTAIASNNAGVRAEPKAQGRITRPVARTPQQAQQQVQQQRVAQQRRQAQAQRRTQQAPVTADQKFVADARRVLAQPTQQRVRSTNVRAAQSYRVRRGDTLSKVAKRLGYSSVRSEQMMMALFEKNRRAFTSNNMNNLKAGALLKRPSLQEAKVLSSKKAKAQMIAQAREWKKARGIAITSKSTIAKVETTPAANNQQARLTVAGITKDSTANTGKIGTADIAALNQKLTLTTESLTTKQKENEELKSRVTELESLLRKKNRLITLKSEQLAKLQVAASEVTPEATTEIPVIETIMEPAAPITTDVAEEADLQAQIANELAQENGVIVRGEDLEATPEVEIEPLAQIEPEPVVEPLAQIEPEAEVKPNPVFADEVLEPKTDILSMLQSPVVLGSGALLGLLGLGGMWFMRRRKDDSYEEFGSIEVDNGMNDDAEASEIEAEEYDFDDSMINESEYVAHDEVVQNIDSEEDVTADNGEEDILQEADVYIVYGLHDQAESELKQAIEKNPNNMAYRAKLLENYKAAGDIESFEAEAKAFIDHESADKDKYLEEISEWGSSLNPASKLFGGATAGVAMVAGTALADDADEDLAEMSSETVDIDMEGLDLDDGLEDFNLDELLSDADDGLEISAEKSLAGDLDDMNDISIDIDMDDMDLEAEVDGGQFDEIGALSTEMDSIDDLLIGNDSIDLPEGLDFANLDDDIASLDTDLLDTDLEVPNLNLDIDSEDFDKIMPEGNAYKSSGDEIDMLLDDGEAEDNLLAEFDDNLSFLDLDDDADAIEETQVDTKLDLAKAYIDMGDIEGARSTLEEVMQDGSDDQKREAEELLSHTG